MTKIILYTQNGKKHGETSLPEELFTLPWSDALVHQVVTGIAANRRTKMGSAHTKGRSDVRGGGRKPWRQKGTGRARHGSIRSPLWVGGGVTFGPRKEKDYSVSINKKMRAKAFFTVLSEKARNNTMVFVDSFTIEEPSTKTAAACLEGIYGTSGTMSCTVVFAENDIAVRKSFMNLPGVKTVGLATFNTLDAVAAQNIVFVGAEKTVARFKERGSILYSESTVDTK